MNWLVISALTAGTSSPGLQAFDFLSPMEQECPKEHLQPQSEELELLNLVK